MPVLPWSSAFLRKGLRGEALGEHRCERGGKGYVTSFSCSQDESGGVLALIGVIRADTTTDFSTAQRLQALLEFGVDATYMQAADGSLLFVSPAAERVLGYSVEEQLGRNGRRNCHPDDLPAIEKAYRYILAEPGRSTGPVTYRMRHKNGKWLWMRGTAINLLHVPGVKAVVLTQHDITPLREAEDFMEQAQELAQLGSWSSELGQRGRQIWSKYVYRILGLDPQRTMGGVREFLRRVHPEDRPSAVAASRSVLLGESDYDLQHRIVRPDGAVRWIHGRGTLIRDASSGEAYKMMGFVQDISERRQMQEQLLQAQKMEAVGLLAGGIAHDFNNMLSVIVGFSELAAASLADHPTQEDLNEVLGAARKASALTRQLLAFSRKQVLQPRVVSLNELVLGFRPILDRLLGEGIELDLALNAGIPSVEIDPAQMEQVLLNLAVNARDAVPHLGGVVRIETDHLIVESGWHPEIRPGAYVRLTLQDNGSGIAPEILPHIFEPFYTTKGKGQATGLGLSTVFGILKQSSGHVVAHSVVGEGTTIQLYLPAVAREEVGATAAPSSSLQGGETILLVEDEPQVRRFARKALAVLGYRVLEAEDGHDALRVANEFSEPIELLLTDVVMPRMGGRHLAERLLAVRSATRVIYMSGYTEDSVLKDGVHGQVFHFLAKPFTPEELGRKVRHVLDA